MAPGPGRIAVRGARLFDGTSAELRPDPVVIVDGARIVSVGHGTEIPPDTELVDLGDVTLLPGLIDTHVHLAFDASPDVVGVLAARDDDAVLEHMTRAARTALQAGITTVRDLGDRDYLALDLRGRPDLPTILASGPPVTTPNGHCHYLGGVASSGVDGIRRAVREHVDRMVDIVKIMASGGTLTPGTHQHRAQFTRAELRAAVDEAHRAGVPVTAHAHATAAIANALAAGVDGIEHATFWTEVGVESPPALMQEIVTRQVAVGVTVGSAPVTDPGIGPPPAVAARLPLIIANIGRLAGAGARVVIGTDAGIGVPKPHDVLTHAPSQLVRTGMPDVAILHAMTSVAAEVLALGATKGRVAAGYDADLIAVAGNPLADWAALRRVTAVFARGVRVR